MGINELGLFESLGKIRNRLDGYLTVKSVRFYALADVNEAVPIRKRILQAVMPKLERFEAKLK